jgi:hypothetical protein
MMGEDTQESTAFATAGDLELRWHTLTDTEKTQAETLLADASDKIRSRIPQASDPTWVQAHASTLKRVCCAMVKRAMQQLSSGMPAGVTQSSETTGPFSNSFSWSNPDGNLYLTKEELRDFGIGMQQAFHITLTNEEE